MADRAIIKTIVNAEGDRRLQIYQRDDGFFSFSEDVQARSFDGDLCWTPAWPSPSPICDSQEIAEHEAIERIPWLQQLSS